MIATYTEPQRTPFTVDQLIDMLRDGFGQMLGYRAPDEVVAVAGAKVRLEIGNGAHCWNWNLGNMKQPESESGQYTCIELNEVIGGKVLWFAPGGRIATRGGPVIAESWSVPPGHPQTRMKAFAGPTDGVYQYLDFVAKRPRYRKAWEALLAGNPEAYSRELSKAGYYTANVEVYTAQVVKLFSQTLAQIKNQPVEPAPPLERWEIIELVTLVKGGELDRAQDDVQTVLDEARRNDMRAE